MFHLEIGDKISVGKRREMLKDKKEYKHWILVTQCDIEPVSAFPISREEYAPPARFVKQYGGYELKSKIGKGGFGNVYMVYSISFKKYYAMKCPNKISGRKVNAAEWEMETLSSLQDCPFIIRFVRW